jgi:hypothetical protein
MKVRIQREVLKIKFNCNTYYNNITTYCHIISNIIYYYVNQLLKYKKHARKFREFTSNIINIA